MESFEILKPIEKKIQQWVYYEANKPKVPYRGNEKLLDNFRKENDLDCQLTEGNLEADTIFSLWLPLRFTLVELNGYAILNKIGNMKDKPAFKAALMKHDLEKLLPVNEPIVQKLSELFRLGMKRENVMILPKGKREINKERGASPYYDYVPYFLHDCFQGGKFANYFKDDNELVEWIKKEKLEMFFENEEKSISKIKDLSGTGSVKINRTKTNSLETMLDNYIYVLKARGKFY